MVEKLNLESIDYHCSSSRFPFVEVRPVIRHFGYFCYISHCSLLLAFSLHFSSFSAFPWSNQSIDQSFYSSSDTFSVISLFRQYSHLSCCLPRFLQPSCFFVSNRLYLSYIREIKRWLTIFHKPLFIGNLLLFSITSVLGTITMKVP